MSNSVPASLRYLLARNALNELPIRSFNEPVPTGTSVQELIDAYAAETLNLALGSARRVCAVGGFVVTMSDDGRAPVTLYREQWSAKEVAETRRFEVIFLEEGFDAAIRDIEVLALDDCMEPLPLSGGGARRPAELDTPDAPPASRRLTVLADAERALLGQSPIVGDVSDAERTAPATTPATPDSQPTPPTEPSFALTTPEMSFDEQPVRDAQQADTPQREFVQDEQEPWWETPAERDPRKSDTPRRAHMADTAPAAPAQDVPAVAEPNVEARDDDAEPVDDAASVAGSEGPAAQPDDDGLAEGETQSDDDTAQSEADEAEEQPDEGATEKQLDEDETEEVPADDEAEVQSVEDEAEELSDEDEELSDKDEAGSVAGSDGSSQANDSGVVDVETESEDGEAQSDEDEAESDENESEEDDKDARMPAIKNGTAKPRIKQPPGITVPLYDHQLTGIEWKHWREQDKNCPGGILADEPGLGKTLTVGAFLLWVKEMGYLTGLSSHVKGRKRARGALVVVPKVVLHQWSKQLTETFMLPCGG